MKSQINLYHANEIEDDVKLKASSLFKLFLTLLVALVLWNIFVFVQVIIAKDGSQKAFVLQQEQFQHLTDYQAEFPNKITSLNLTKVLDDTEITLNEKQMIFEALTFSENSSFAGFYLSLDALATADIDNLWLTHFTFSDAMASMEINGIAKQASDVTAYLKSLQKTIFSGATFNGIEIYPLDSKADAIQFKINTKKDEFVSEIQSNNDDTTIKTPKWSSLEQTSKIAENLSNSLIGGE